MRTGNALSESALNREIYVWTGGRRLRRNPRRAKLLFKFCADVTDASLCRAQIFRQDMSSWSEKEPSRMAGPKTK